MKSRTSSFNLTVFRKDLTRFAPAWGIYLIVLLLTLVAVYEEDTLYYRLRAVSDAIVFVGIANLIYGAVVAQLLFGDLYNSRLCNALHAFPVTREGWFATHTAAGLVFSLLPNLVAAVLALAVLGLGSFGGAVFWWLLGATLQYQFFFGIGVLCVMLSGNRLGQIALYSIVNFAAMAAWWLASRIYQPLLYGIQINGESFYPFSPAAELTQMSDMLVIDYQRLENEFGDFAGHAVHGMAPGEGWGYMAILAAAGLLALGGALVLYRKRKLECAGDFVAFRVLEPVVTVLATIFVGGFFHLFGDLTGAPLRTNILLATGAVVGFFACRMLLARSTRVFNRKSFLGFGAIVAVFLLTVGLTVLDPAGITRYVPEANQVESVTVSNSYSMHRHGDQRVDIQDAADIRAILGVHGDCITKKATSMPGDTEEEYYPVSLRLEYRLKNGKTVNRFYDVHPMSDAGQILKGYFTKPECVLGFPAEQAQALAPCIRSFYTDGREMDSYDLSGLDLPGLLEAVIADCKAGNMAQFDGYHYPPNFDLLGGTYDFPVTFIELGWDSEKLTGAANQNSTSRGIMTYTSFTVFRSCENTLKWLDDHGLLLGEQGAWASKYGGAYGEFAIPSGT